MKTGVQCWRLASLLAVVLLLLVSSAGVLSAQGGPIDGDPSAGDPYRPNEGNAGYDVEHYDLELRIEPRRQTIRGVASIALTPTVDLRSFAFDLSGFTVSAVEVDAVQAGFERMERKLRITPAEPLPEGRTITVRVTYAGKPKTTNKTGWLWFKHGGALVSTQTNGASTLFPSNDHPSDKVTFAFDLTTPRNTIGIANGLLERQSNPEGGMTRFEWSEPAPFPTYAAVVAVGLFRLVEEAGPHGLPIINAFPTRDGKKFKNKEARKQYRRDLRQPPGEFRDQGEIVAVLEDYFGPYPYSSIGAIVPPIEGVEALEAASRPTYPGVRGVVRNRDFELLVAHEIAQQWFGNAVTLASWRDMWLNEGFATYSELLWIAEKRQVGIGSLFARDSSVFGYYRDMRRPAGDPGAGHVFSVTVYNRGALTLEALRRTVGDDDFYRILRAYYAEFRSGNATTDDFIQLAESVSGQNLDDLFQRWLYERGLPDLPPEQSAGA